MFDMPRAFPEVLRRTAGLVGVECNCAANKTASCFPGRFRWPFGFGGWGGFVIEAWRSPRHRCRWILSAVTANGVPSQLPCSVFLALPSPLSPRLPRA